MIGSGPAGMACAQQLARAGHGVTLFEKSDRIGGLLRYGIPDFKMEKRLIDRRMRQMEAEGVEFRAGVEIGVTVSVKSLLESYDAVVMSCGAEHPRDLDVPGRELRGIHFAMDYLTQQNKRVAGDDETRAAPRGTISAKGKHVIVIGGGDTGSDCIGTSNRQGAASITQLEIMPQPPEKEDKALTWPDWPLKMRTSSSQEEGCDRDWAVLTKRAIGARRQDRSARMRARRMGEGRERPLPDEGNGGQRVSAEGRSGAAGDGVPRPAQARLDRTGGRRARSARQRQGRMPWITRRRRRKCSPAATCAAASRSSSGRSAKAANARAPSTSS